MTNDNTETKLIQTQSKFWKIEHEDVIIAGIDPSFISGDYTTTLYIGSVGYNVNGQYGVELLEQIPLTVDNNDKVNPYYLLLADEVMSECNRRRIPPKNLAVCATGVSMIFCDILEYQWKPGFLRVHSDNSIPKTKCIHKNILTTFLHRCLARTLT